MQSYQPRHNANFIQVCHIDDDEGYLQIIAQLLNNISPKTYKITSITSPKEALFTLNSNPNFDIIISDFEMPDLNGLDVFDNIVNHGIDIPFILLTGSKNEDAPSIALNKGVKFFLRKDGDIIALVKQLDQLIKITISQVKSEHEIIENELMMSDFIYLLTNPKEKKDDHVYSLFFKNILQSFIGVCNCEYAFLNEINRDQTKNLFLGKSFFSWTSWTEENGHAFELVSKEQFRFNCLEEYYTKAFLDKIPIIENDLHSRKLDDKKSNKNKLNLCSFLALPIFFEPNKTLVGIVGLVNRVGGFDEKIIFKLQPFCLNLSNYLYLKIYMTS